MNTFQKSKTTQSDNTHSVFFADLETMLKNKPTVKVKPQKVPTRKSVHDAKNALTSHPIQCKTQIAQNNERLMQFLALDKESISSRDQPKNHEC